MLVDRLIGLQTTYEVLPTSPHSMRQLAYDNMMTATELANQLYVSS
jgi:hypothetical protein